MDSEARYLIFHSSIVLLIGLLVGGAYGRAINRNAPAHIVNAWRVAHGSLPLGAAIGLSVGALLPSLNVGASLKALVAWSWIASNSAFCVSLPLAAILGHRGLAPARPAANRLVYLGNSIGAAASLIGAIALLYALL